MTHLNDVKAIRWRLILLAVIGSVALAAAGYGYYLQEARAIRKEKYADLKAISSLKIDQIVQWRKERLGDAAMQLAGPIFRTAVGPDGRLSAEPDVRASIRRGMELIREACGYDDVILASVDGRVLLSLNPHLPRLDANANRLVEQAVLTKKIAFADFFRCPDCDRVHLDAAEIFAEVRHHGWMVLILVALAILLAIGMASFAFYRWQRSLYRDLYRSERRRREAQEEIRTTLYSIGDGVIATDQASRITRLNPTAEQLTGWRESEALGQPVEEVFRIVNEYTRAEVENPVARVIRDGVIVGLANHTILLARDGAERPIADSGAPIRDEAGRIVGAVLVFRDQTQQREAESAIQRERDYFRAIMTASPMGMLVLDPEEQIVEANPAAERLLQNTLAELKQKRCGDFACCIHRLEDARGCTYSSQCPNCTLHAAARSALDHSEATHDQDVEIVHDFGKGSERRHYAFGVEPAVLDGRRHAVVALTDITDRKRAEENLRVSEDRYRRLFENMTEAFALHEILCDEAGEPCDYRFLDVNPAFERQTGLKREAVIGRTLREVLPEEDPGWIKTYGVVALSGRPTNFDNHSAALGKYFHVYAYSPAPRSFAVLFTDVTERWQAQEERRQMEAQLQQAQKLESLGVLAGGIAHDFNNILAGIRAFADLVQADPTASSSVCEKAAQISKATARAADLTRQILTYAGKGTIQLEPLDLSRMVDDMKVMLEVAVSKKATLEYRLTPDLGTTLGDAGQIRQVIMNLVVNASESLGDKSGTIAIATSRVQVDDECPKTCVARDSLPSGPYICLEVTDSGCGMDEATRDKIFEPFFTTKFVGRGLGLATVHGIVRAHRGAVGVSSEPSKGSLFRVCLPVGGSGPPLAESEVVPRDRPRASGTVLIADDEEMVRMGMQALFQSAGFQVLTAIDGREALETYQRHRDRLACIVLDLTMPEMGGEEVFHEIRRTDPDVRVILTSGYTADTMMHRFDGQNVFGFVQKPDSVDAMIAKLQHALANP